MIVQPWMSDDLLMALIGPLLSDLIQLYKLNLTGQVPLVITLILIMIIQIMIVVGFIQNIPFTYESARFG